MECYSKLTSLVDLYCAQCSNFLNPPIMLSQNSKNTCGRCYEKQENKDGFIENVALENLIKQLEIPCRYFTQGCKDMLTEQRLLTHEAACDYKPTECPISQCCWSGFFKQLKQHLIARHEDSTTSLTNLIYEFVVNIDKQYDMQRLLLWNTKLFLLNINILKDSIKLTVCHTNNYTQLNNNGDCLKFIVEEMDNMRGIYYKLGRSENISNYSTNCTGIDLINANELKTLNTDVVNIKIKIFFGDKPRDIDNKYLKTLECPICLEYMSREIYNCTNGHSVCVKCKVTECPLCKSIIENSRNFGLESIYDITNVPCVNRSLGCAVVAPGAEMKAHEDLCKFEKYSCLVSDCGYSGGYFDLLFEHYNYVHCIDHNNFTVKYLADDELMEGFVKCEDSYNAKRMIAYNHIFTVEYTQDDNQLLFYASCLKKLTSEFQYEVSFGNKRKKIVCSSVIDNDITNNQVIIPLECLTDENDIYCSVRIMRL